MTENELNKLTHINVQELSELARKPLTFNELLSKYRAESQSEREQDTRFERLIKANLFQ